MIVKEAPSEYVVSLQGGSRETAIRAVLEAFEGIVVLDTQGDAAALVLAEQEAIDRVARERPDLLIERNIRYSRTDSPR